MYIKKNFGFLNILYFTGWHLAWILVWVLVVAGIHAVTHWEWMEVPWLPISVIGTAVAFYIGFKNNQAYDRLWEARKIWGGIVNSSRAWGSMVRAYVTNQFAEQHHSDEERWVIHKKLIYRHIAWLYALRSQLLLPTPWEHISQGERMRKVTESRMRRYGIGLLGDLDTEKYLRNYLPKNEHDRLINYRNTATQIIDQQAQDLVELRAKNLIDDFRHMELQNILNQFYDQQGMCERIKKFPLPRQYGSMSFIFVGLFIFLLPFGMISAFHDMAGHWGHVVSIPLTVIVAWVYVTMELIGDYSENPFEGLGNDIPMLSLCRVIEIDLKEMLGEADIPEPVEAINGVLM
jgi:ion channel-forming bestrophin family protein